MKIPVYRLRVGDESIAKAAVGLAARKYPDFDQGAALAWGLAALKRDDVAIFATPNCFAVLVTYRRFWAPEIVFADWVLLFSGRDDKRSVGELLTIARAVKEWLDEVGAARLYVDDALLGIDLGPLIRRIGAPRQYRGYVVEFSARG